MSFLVLGRSKRLILSLWYKGIDRTPLDITNPIEEMKENLTE